MISSATLMSKVPSGSPRAASIQVTMNTLLKVYQRETLRWSQYTDDIIIYIVFMKHLHACGLVYSCLSCHQKRHLHFCSKRTQSLSRLESKVLKDSSNRLHIIRRSGPVISCRASLRREVLMSLIQFWNNFRK